MGKNEILKKFSADPGRYYKVKLFEEKGFARKSCVTCHRFYWTIDENRTNCPDHSEDMYSFIGNPPTKKRFDYTQSWKEVESFFVKNGHTSVSRYPVVCRWRDDLYFTIASIVDFQRVMGSKVIFEFPANPLVVPQTCLRFKDIENVGVTGKHFSSFCMIGQHSIPNSQGYWKDKCVDLDYRLLTEQFGIDKKEIVFVEDVWEGGGSFGSSLEFFVRGLELGNAVFTEFQGDLANHSILDQKIIDMGAGLERFAWITMGTPSAYDCCFGPITEKLINQTGIDAKSSLLVPYFTEIAKNLEKYDDLSLVRKNAIKTVGLSEEQVNQIITPLEGIYMVSDHIRTLIFAISDGALPSNVGGGYNLRMMLRRILSTIDRLALRFDVNEIIDVQIDYLKKTYPELEKTRNDVKTIIEIESDRYRNSKQRMQKIVSKITGTPSVDDLIRLYESDGVTPDHLKEMKVISDIPSTFYTKLSELHQSAKKEKLEDLPLEGLPETELLYYSDDPKKFSAKVLKSFDKYVVLDRTSFYARGGGQEPDHGTIAGFEVVDVNKHGNIVVHELKGGIPKQGETVECIVDSARRDGITKHHTSTHILNSSSRNVLGSWVWQHSAFKEVDHARLDITHHSALTDNEVAKIEQLANAKVKENIPVTIQNYNRGTAEQKYGFRIYQGGIVPVKSVRIVSIEDFDVEACGGTHVKTTKDVELIKITRTKRIQDGVVRLEFVAGKTAQEYVKQQKIDVKKHATMQAVTEERNKLRAQKIQQDKEKILQLLQYIQKINPEKIIEDYNTAINNTIKNIQKLNPEKIIEDYNTAINNTIKNIQKLNPEKIIEDYQKMIEKSIEILNSSQIIANYNAINNEIKNRIKNLIPPESHEDIIINLTVQNFIEETAKQDKSKIEKDKIYAEYMGTGWFYYTTDDQYDEYFHVSFGEKLVKKQQSSIYCGIFTEEDTIRVIVHAGALVNPTKNAEIIVKEISKILGGSGGGNPRFAQGGGPDKSKKEEAVRIAKSMVLG